MTEAHTCDVCAIFHSSAFKHPLEVKYLNKRWQIYIRVDLAFSSRKASNTHKLARVQQNLCVCRLPNGTKSTRRTQNDFDPIEHWRFVPCIAHLPYCWLVELVVASFPHLMYCFHIFMTCQMHFPPLYNSTCLQLFASYASNVPKQIKFLHF